MSNVTKKEIEQFAKDSSHWWDPQGPFKPLHKLNPVRIEYIRNQILSHFLHRHCEPQVKQSTNNIDCRVADAPRNDILKDLSIIDVGCGGGLVCEPFARQGANVTGTDADENAIAVAKEHAQRNNLEITYQNMLVENITEKYDVVLALEIIEHVPNPEQFVKSCFDVCKPNGLVIFSTLNRTPKSYALGIVAAEYILNWVPKGTHHWKQFVKPSELAKHVRQQNGDIIDVSGLRYHPLSDRFSIDPRDVDVNYFLVAGKETSASLK